MQLEPGHAAIVPDAAIVDLDLTNFTVRQLPDNNTLVRRNTSTDQFCEIRVASVGNVDAGKSSLVATLCYNSLDDGKGLARSWSNRYDHEEEYGRTSSVNHAILGFDSQGRVVNRPRGDLTSRVRKHRPRLVWQDVCAHASKIISFSDLPGHEKYVKTTVLGLTGHAPHYAMLVLGANTGGLTGTTLSHLGLIMALRLPFFVVVTKIDMAPDNILHELKVALAQRIRGPGVRRVPMDISTASNVITAVQDRDTCPIFYVSNVTGAGLDTLRLFLDLIPVRGANSNSTDPLYMRVDDVYQVTGIGPIISGTVTAGHVCKDMVVTIGPLPDNTFASASIRDVHCNRLDTGYASAGASCTVALRGVKHGQLRKGLVLLPQNTPAHASRRFVADILVVRNPSTIFRGYQATVHIESVQQTCSFIKIWGRDEDPETNDIFQEVLEGDDARPHLKLTDRRRVTLQFMQRGEYIQPGQTIIIREDKCRAVGTIVSCIQDDNVTVLPKRTSKKRQRRANKHTLYEL